MVKKIIVNLLVISFIIAAIKTKYIRFIEINKVIPDFILIFTVFNGFYFGSTYGMFFGFFSGLAFDISSYPLVGFFSLIYTTVGYFTGVSKIIDIDNPLISSIVLLIFNLFKYLIFFITGLLFQDTETVFNYFRNFFLIETFYTLVVSIPIFLIYRRFDKNSRNFRTNV